MSIIRKRLPPDQSRAAAMDAARLLLIEAGPQAVTLKAVAARIGRTHANLLHHFGSAAGLQEALAAHLAETITATIGDAVLRARRGEIEIRAIVDLTFDAFDSGGAGALASWMLISGNRDALDSIVQAIHRLTDELIANDPNQPEIPEHTLMLVLSALGDSLMGAHMAKALGLPREAARALATRNLFASMALAGSRDMHDSVMQWVTDHRLPAASSEATP